MSTSLSIRKVESAPDHQAFFEFPWRLYQDEPNWVPPLSLHAEPVRAQPVGQLYHAVTNGIRTMPPYASQISVEDRWAVVLYVRALQRSQNATPEDVPEEMREKLR